VKQDDRPKARCVDCGACVTLPDIHRDADSAVRVRGIWRCDRCAGDGDIRPYVNERFLYKRRSAKEKA